MTQPVKRGPGRPRKNPPPEAATLEVRPDVPAEEKPTAEADPRIGMEVHPDATHVGFDDGVQYHAEGGVITRRVD